MHSGGDEFLVDQGGQDVTELFDDAGHSEQARNILKTLASGTAKVRESLHRAAMEKREVLLTEGWLP